MTFGDYLGLLGLLVALYQIRKAERAALAAKRAVEATSSQVNVYTLLLLVTDLAIVERDLERAALANLKTETQAKLRDWQVYASEMRGLLSEQWTAADGLEERVQESMVLATQSRSLIAKDRATPEKATERVRASAADVVLMARTEAARVRAAIPATEAMPTLVDDVGSAWNWLTARVLTRSKS